MFHRSPRSSAAIPSERSESRDLPEITMNRVKRLFKHLRAEERCGVIAYVTCGDPDVATTPCIIEELERAGADAIELGVPFSDPIADGPVIQQASQRALRSGTTINDLFAIART